MTFLEAVQKVYENDGGFAVYPNDHASGYATYYGCLGRCESQDRLGYAFGVMISNVFRVRDWTPSPDALLGKWAYEER